MQPRKGRIELKSSSKLARTPETPTQLNLSSPEKVNFYHHQLRAWYSEKKIIALIGGTGAGKTWFAPYWIVLQRLQKPGTRLLAIGMGYQKHVERVMVYELEQFLKRYGFQYRINRSTGILTLQNDSQIIFGSAENPESLEGVHLDGGCWIDEAGYMPRIAWDVADRRTALHNAPILVTTVPYFWNWVKTDIKDRYDAGDKSIEYIHCSSRDNLDYPREALDRIKATKRPEYFEIYYEGNFARPYGLIYPDIDYEFTVFDEEEYFPNGIPDDWPAFSGHDFGINNPNAAVWGRLAPDGTLFIVAEYQAPTMTMKNHIERWRRAGLDEVDASFGDPSGADQMLTAEENNFQIQKANNDILMGIDLVQTRLQTGKLRVARSCKQIIDYFSLYVWKKNPKNDDELLEEPEPGQPASHMLDALRYMTTGIFEHFDGSDGGVDVVVRRKRYAA